MFKKFDAEEDFQDLKEIFVSYLDLLELGVAVSDGIQLGDDLPALIKVGTNLPAAIAGFGDGVDAIKVLSDEQRNELKQMVTDRKSFPDDITDDAVDKLTIGAIYFAQGAMVLFNKE